jgi:hypothetical protein
MKGLAILLFHLLTNIAKLLGEAVPVSLSLKGSLRNGSPWSFSVLAVARPSL